MNLLFASMPTYGVTLDFEQSYWHRARRLSADLVFERVSGALPPAGKKSLCRGMWVIASAAKRAGHSIRWVDLSADSPMIACEDSAWADQIWLYAMTPTLDECLRLARGAKQANPSLTTILGGPHTRCLFEETLKRNPEIDFAEAATSSVDLIVEHIRAPSRIPGLAFMVDGRVVVNEARCGKTYSEQIDPGVLSSPLRDYFINTSSSLGCAMSCDFCVDGRTPLRLRDLADVKNELLLLDQMLEKDDMVHFFDSSFSQMPHRCVELARFISGETAISGVSVDIDARTIRQEALDALCHARLRSAAIGFESCNNAVLKAIGKDGTFEDRVAIAQRIKKAMPTTVLKAYWLLGLPGSNPRSLENELTGIRYVLEERIVDLVSVKLFVPYPGTVFFKEPRQYDLRVVQDYRRFDRFSLPPACCPISIGHKKLWNTLIRCEQLIAELYASRLGKTVEGIVKSRNGPRGYNGAIYR